MYFFSVAGRECRHKKKIKYQKKKSIGAYTHHVHTPHKMLNVYLSGSGVRLDENFKIIQTVLHAYPLQVHSIHGNYSGAFAAVLLVEALQCDRYNMYVYTRTVYNKIVQLSKQRTSLLS
jgi:hypothetical protein